MANTSIEPANAGHSRVHPISIAEGLQFQQSAFWARLSLWAGVSDRRRRIERDGCRMEQMKQRRAPLLPM